MEKKRAPGAGRKPSGPYRGKSATLTTRITPELRAGLEREARGRGHSLSQEIEKRLRNSIETPRKIDQALGERHVRALAILIARIARIAEGHTGLRWREDRFTFVLVRDAITNLLDLLDPAGDLTIPIQVEERGSRMTSRYREHMDSPEAVVMVIAQGIAEGLYDQILIAERPPIDHPATDHYADEYFELSFIREDLGIGGGRK